MKYIIALFIVLAGCTTTKHTNKTSYTENKKSVARSTETQSTTEHVHQSILLEDSTVVIVDEWIVTEYTIVTLSDTLQGSPPVALPARTTIHRTTTEKRHVASSTEQEATRQAQAVTQTEQTTERATEEATSTKDKKTTRPFWWLWLIALGAIVIVSIKINRSVA